MAATLVLTACAPLGGGRAPSDAAVAAPPGSATAPHAATGSTERAGHVTTPALDAAERACVAEGWQPVAMQVAGLSRRLLWQAPPGPWRRGVVLVLHGGGGRHTHWCGPSRPLARAQTGFVRQALADGFAVVLADSTDAVTDAEGRVCGKVWDDGVNDRPNLDLAFFGALLDDGLPRIRPIGSRPEVFITGLSSGGYMTVRAATHFGPRFAAFAPVAAGDPYGWHRQCIAGLTPRRTVHGIGLDNETGRPIPQRASCASDAYPQEARWDGLERQRQPPFRLFRHAGDGIVDASCTDKLGRQLRAHGYPGEPDFQLQGGPRGLMNHLWQSAYDRPVLDFFLRILQASGAQATSRP